MERTLQRRLNSICLATLPHIFLLFPSHAISKCADGVLLCQFYYLSGALQLLFLDIRLQATGRAGLPVPTHLLVSPRLICHLW